MRKKLSLLFVVMLIWASSALAATQAAIAAQAPDINAEAAVLMVAKDKRVLFGKNQDGIMYPASTTKIVTLITALENSNLDKVIVVSPKAAACEGSSLELNAGDKLVLREALYGMMLVSGNDAAEAIAENIGGSIPAFVQMMNATAEKIGAKNTHFSNPHGLPDPINHFTTAYDLALFAAYGLNNPEFAKIVATKSYDVHFLDGHITHVYNTNKLLKTYAGADGVKTGFTNAAGECLVASATRNGVQLIAVVLNSDDRWNDAAKLLDYGFSQMGL